MTMDDLGMPDELAELEERLARRRGPEPSAALRSRVLGAMRRETVVPAPAVARVGLWRFAAAVAAALLLCMNLSMSAANRMEVDVWGRPEPAEVTSLARQLREAVPELTEEEALRTATVMSSRRPLIPMPPVRGAHDGLDLRSGTLARTTKEG